MYPWYGVIKLALDLCGLPVTQNSNLIVKKMSDKFWQWDIPPKAWPERLRAVKVIKNKQPEKLSQPRAT